MCRLDQGSTNGTMISSQYGTFTANTRIIRNAETTIGSKIPFRVRFTRTEDGNLIYELASHKSSQVKPKMSRSIVSRSVDKREIRQIKLYRREMKKSDCDRSDLEVCARF